jgi:hypothetical protein
MPEGLSHPRDEEKVQVNVRLRRTKLIAAKALAAGKDMSLTGYFDDLLQRDAQANAGLVIESFDKELEEIAERRAIFEALPVTDARLETQ